MACATKEQNPWKVSYHALNVCLVKVKPCWTINFTLYKTERGRISTFICNFDPCAKLDMPLSQRLGPFQRGLRPDIRFFVLSKRPYNITDAEELAKLWEDIHNIEHT